MTLALRIAVSFSIASFLCAAVHAQTTYRWAGGNGGSWQEPSNWSPQGVPGSEDRAVFEDEADVTLDADVTVDEIAAEVDFGLITFSSSDHEFVRI